MTKKYIIPIIIFAFSMSITPGPNNIMLTASGANFGYRKTIPHILGIFFGLSSLLILSAIGLKQLFDAYPFFNQILKVLGVSYMLFLAFKIMRSSHKTIQGKSAKPFSFFQAALFQVVNPKAVMMAITSISVYSLSGDKFYFSIFLIIFIFNMVGIISTSIWTVFGTIIGLKLKNERYIKVFNYTLAFLTACAAILLII